VSGANFRQHRKADAAHCEPTIRRVLASWYDVDPEAVVCVEGEAEGRHDPDTLDSGMLLDYAGVDWLIDDSPEIIPVSQRVRPQGEDIDFSIRVRNEAAPACEYSVLSNSPLAPEVIVFARADGPDVSGVWLLDPDRVLGVLNSVQGERHDSGDGTVAEYLTIEQLQRNGCVVDEADPETLKRHPDVDTGSADKSHMGDGGNHDLTDEEIRKIESDPVLTVDDVVEMREGV